MSNLIRDETGEEPEGFFDLFHRMREKSSYHTRDSDESLVTRTNDPPPMGEFGLKRGIQPWMANLIAIGGIIIWIGMQSFDELFPQKRANR